MHLESLVPSVITEIEPKETEIEVPQFLVLKRTERFLLSRKRTSPRTKKPNRSVRFGSNQTPRPSRRKGVARGEESGKWELAVAEGGRAAAAARGMARRGGASAGPARGARWGGPPAKGRCGGGVEGDGDGEWGNG